MILFLEAVVLLVSMFISLLWILVFVTRVSLTFLPESFVHTDYSSARFPILQTKSLRRYSFDWVFHYHEKKKPTLCFGRM